jgi:polysaccharide deacetylase 2 family uncharacterized protein YibQ
MNPPRAGAETTEAAVIGRFLLGSGLGALVGTGLLALASVVSPAPEMPGAAAKPDATTGSASDTAGAAAPDAAPEAAPQPPGPTEEPGPVETAEASEAAPAVSTDAAAEAAPAALPDTTAAAPEVTPETALATGAEEAVAGSAPAPVADAPEGLAEPGQSAAPVLPAATDAPGSSQGPQSPADLAADPAPVAVPAPAAAPDVATAPVPKELPEATEGEDAALAALPAGEMPPADPADPALPSLPVPEAAPVAVDLPGPPPLTPEEEALLRQLAEGSPGNPEAPPADAPPADALPGTPPEPAPEAAPETDPETAEAQPGQLPADDPLPEVGTAGVGLIEPDPALPSASSPPEEPEGVTTGRLPRIGDAVAAPESAVEAETPLTLYARAFDNPEAKPAFAIVLIDDGAEGLDRAALAALPFAVSFALDPTHPQAAEHAAIYRAAGQEVVMMASALPAGAQASDVEVAMAAMAQALPESIAVMDQPEAAFQADRPLATMVVATVAGQGRGLLTWDQGLNAADQVARREDVPAAVAFRDLDGAGETASVIRRYLDRAAFKAAQEGRVTVIGRARPDTLAAILEWTVEGRAATVALAPLSAVLSVD